MIDGKAADQVIDVMPDELVLARAQLDAGLPGLAEGTLRRRIARLEADGVTATHELDAARTLLAEALWRQHQLVTARGALDAVRPSSPQRRLPIATMIEAEALAAAGESDRAAGAMERVITAVGVEQAFLLRRGVPGRLSWPMPAELRPRPARAARPPWAARDAGLAESPEAPEVQDVASDERSAAARSRMEDARAAYVAGDLDRGDAAMSIALRLDPTISSDGVEFLGPTLGGQPAQERLLLYGDLLRAAGREVEANQAFDRAAGQDPRTPPARSEPSS